MDYSSSLGPIDPQVWNGKQYVPALGYLDKVEALLRKAADGTLLNAEFLILQNQDLAMLSRYEQARNLTITLLKKWLVEYKFRNWNTHQTNPTKIGQPVTKEEKEARAEVIRESHLSPTTVYKILEGEPVRSYILSGFIQIIDKTSA